MSIIERTAGAPISWGICETPGWGLQLPADRVLGEMHELGLTATELGAAGYLPTDVDELRDLLDRHELSLVAGFVGMVLHDPARADEARATARSSARLLAGAGATHFVTAAISAVDDWEHLDLDAAGWDHLLAMIGELEDLTAEQGLTQVVHPHYDTVIETAAEVERVVDGCDAQICLDTGHLALGGADPLRFAIDHASRVGLVHLKDVRSGVADRLAASELDLVGAVQAGLFAPLGEGDIPIEATVIALEQAGYDGWYVLEQDAALTTGEPPVGSGPIRDVEISVAFLRSLAGTVTPTPGRGTTP